MLEDIFKELSIDGVDFRYHDEIIPYSTITGIQVDLESNIILELDYEETHTISFNKFKEFHSKEGINYHHWAKVRDFDSLVEENCY